MLYYYQFDIAGLFVLLLSSVTLCVRKGSMFRHAYYALWMMAMAFVFTLADGVSAYLISLANPSYYVLTYVVLLFYFTSLLLFPYFALQFIAEQCDDLQHVGVALFAPVFFVLLFIFSNYYTGIFFTLTKDPFVYYTGHGGWISPVLYLLYAIYAIVLAIRHRRFLGRGRRGVLRLVAVLVLLTFVCNGMIPNYSISGFMICVAISFVVICFYLGDAIMDDKTGIYNRTGFLRRCDEVIYKRKSNDLLLAKMKIHNLQEINERFGMDIGDMVLKRVADSFANYRSGKDMIYGRVGGDTFAIMVPRERFANYSFHVNLGQFVGALINDHEYEVSFYCGVYEIRPEDTDVDSILDRADYAMDRVRGSFKDNVRYFDEELRDEYEKRSRIEQMARSALNHEAFRVYLQPIYDTKTKKLVSAEALVRWTDRDGSIIPPDEFIPIFEKNGFISQVDLFVLEEICKTIQSWKQHNIEPVPVSINVSRVDITSPKFAESLIEIVDSYDIDHSLIKIELTESAFSDQMGLIKHCMNHLRREGFKILMDDFGSGYSNLNMFQDVSVDIVKIDMKFLHNIDMNSKGRVILRSVVDMSKNLGLEIVVEGVETEEQFRIIREMACDMTQGYFFSRPMPLQMFDELLVYEHEKNAKQLQGTAI